jgi:peptidyl-prolyl cis-trans isomerase C
LFNLDVSSSSKAGNAVSGKWLLCGALLIVAGIGLSACSKEKGGGQSLARVNGEDITVLQVNDELSHANIPADQQQDASKKILESLIDRQVIIDEAMRQKIDRSPGVQQTIARAKAQIIEQAYLQSVTSKVDKPTTAEMSDYFHQHPEIFGNGKVYDMNSLLIAGKDMNDKLKAELDSAKTLDEVATWMKSHDVRYARGVASRNTMSMPPEMASKLMTMHAGQMFVVNEGGNSMIVSIANIKDNPIAFEDAAPAIEQYFKMKNTKEVVDNEVKHLRSLAKIEYLNAPAPVAPQQAPAALAKPENKPAGN